MTIYMSGTDDDIVDMDKLHNEASIIDEDSEKEPDSSAGDSDIDEAEPEPDSEIQDTSN